MGGQSLHGTVVSAGEVAVADAFDLDDPGSEIREMARREGRGDRLLELTTVTPSSGRPAETSTSLRLVPSLVTLCVLSRPRFPSGVAVCLPGRTPTPR